MLPVETLTFTKEQRTLPCKIVRMQQDDLDIILNYQQKLCDALQDADIFVPLSRQEWQYLLDHGFALAVLPENPPAHTDSIASDVMEIFETEYESAPENEKLLQYFRIDEKESHNLYALHARFLWLCTQSYLFFNNGFLLEDQAESLAEEAKEAGMDGVVASPQEVAAIREACGEGFLIVTPGIRPAGSDVNDQSRIATPSGALKNGSTHIVVGRPITKAEDKKAAAQSIAAEIRGV